jgi:hypothetical protein
MVTPRAGPSSWVHLVLTSFIYNIYLYNGQREKSFFVIFFYLSLCCSREEIENKSCLPDASIVDKRRFGTYDNIVTQYIISCYGSNLHQPSIKSIGPLRPYRIVLYDMFNFHSLTQEAQIIYA